MEPGVLKTGATAATGAEAIRLRIHPRRHQEAEAVEQILHTPV